MTTCIKPTKWNQKQRKTLFEEVGNGAPFVECLHYLCAGTSKHNSNVSSNPTQSTKHTKEETTVSTTYTTAASFVNIQKNYVTKSQ